MTKYILVGGYDWKGADGGDALFAEMLKGHNKPVKILICLFARPREDWEPKYASELQKFAEKVGDKATLELAFPDSFADQVANADVIFIKGGDDALLDYYLGTFRNLHDLFKDKTVVGSSAGADFLSAYFWTCDWRSVGRSLGLVKVKTIPHYGSTTYAANDPRGPINWEAAKQELKEFGEDLPMHLLGEGEFVVINQDG